MNLGYVERHIIKHRVYFYDRLADFIRNEENSEVSEVCSLQYHLAPFKIVIYITPCKLLN